MARQFVCRGPEPVPERAKPSRDSKLGLSDAESHSKRNRVPAMVNSWPSSEPIVAPLNNYTTRLARARAELTGKRVAGFKPKVDIAGQQLPPTA